MQLGRIWCSALFIVIEAAWRVSGSEGVTQVEADRGADVTLACGPDPDGEPALDSSSGEPSSPSNVMWIHKGQYTHYPIIGGSLYLSNVASNQSGLYECVIDNETAFSTRVHLTVRTEPPPLANVTVHASTILALILWSVAGDGGHPIVDFTAQYRAAAPVNGSLEPWRPISPNHISPNSRQIDVYHLEPNASYWFRVWATNALGPGAPVAVLARTLYVDQDAELVKRFLSGVEEFDVRAWMAAVGVVMGTLAVLAVGTCCVLWREWRAHDRDEDQDVMELVPNIILNPGFVEEGPRPDLQKYSAGSIIRAKERPGPGAPRRV